MKQYFFWYYKFSEMLCLYMQMFAQISFWWQRVKGFYRGGYGYHFLSLRKSENAMKKYIFTSLLGPFLIIINIGGHSFLTLFVFSWKQF